tara:strand:- start:643 stop:1161 length:519 start_codon:yes stop_codon:yes gene_type:complete
MACNTLTEILKGCEGNLGGLTKLWIGNGDSITASTIVDGEVTGATATEVFVEYQFNPNTSNFVESTTVDLATSSTFYTSVITLQLARREAAKRQSLLLIAKGQPELSIMVKDSNGTYWMFGLNDDKVFLTGDEGGSGQAKADLNGYLLTFTAETAEPALQVDSATAGVIGGF